MPAHFRDPATTNVASSYDEMVYGTLSDGTLIEQFGIRTVPALLDSLTGDAWIDMSQQECDLIVAEWCATSPPMDPVLRRILEIRFL